MVCSAIDPRVCEIIPVHGWSVVDSDSLLGIGWVNMTVLVDWWCHSLLGIGWVNMTVLVDWWCHATVSWAAIGGDYGTSGSVTVSAYNSFGAPAYETVSVRTPGPLLITIDSSNIYNEVTVTVAPGKYFCSLQYIPQGCYIHPTGPSITPLLIYHNCGVYTCSFEWMIIAEPNTALFIHVSCYVHTGVG